MHCPSCGTPCGEEVACSNCGLLLDLVRKSVRQSQGRSRRAIYSVIWGIIGLLLFPCCLFCVPISGIPAIIVGVFALSDIRACRGRLKGTRLAWTGIVLGFLPFALWPLYYCVLFPDKYSVFGQADLRAKASWAERGMMSIAHALDTYYIDHRAYPTSLSALCLPQVYLQQIPRDRFGENDQGMDFDYRTDGGTYFILRSIGPNKTPDVDLDAVLKTTDTKARRSRLLQSYYDPTNGIVSGGDILCTPEIPPNLRSSGPGD